MFRVELESSPKNLRKPWYTSCGFYYIAELPLKRPINETVPYNVTTAQNLVTQKCIAQCQVSAAFEAVNIGLKTVKRIKNLNMKKCSNCGNNNITNFRGYPAYLGKRRNFFQPLRPKLIAANNNLHSIIPNSQQPPPAVEQGQTFASIAKGVKPSWSWKIRKYYDATCSNDETVYY